MRKGQQNILLSNPSNLSTNVIIPNIFWLIAALNFQHDEVSVTFNQAVSYN